MGHKISRLTDEQEEYLPIFRQSYIEAAASIEEPNVGETLRLIEGAYKVIGEKKPLLVMLDSPLQCMVCISMMKNVAQLSDQLSGQLRSQLSDQLSDQLWAQLSDQLWSQLSDQLRGQLRGQLWAQLRGQLGGQLWGQLRSQLSAQLRGQLWAQLGGQLSDQLKVRFNSSYLWGSHDGFWIAFHKFCEHIGVRFSDESLRKLNIMNDICRHVEWWWPYKNICIASRRPLMIRWDEERRLHCENGPAVRYADGYSIYSWHGVNVPSDWIEKPNKINPAAILRWDNIEQRRAGCEILGWDCIVSYLEGEVIDADENEEIGVLIEINIPEIGAERFLRVKCGTGRYFSIPMPPHIKTALEGNMWSYGLSPEDYKVEVRT